MHIVNCDAPHNNWNKIKYYRTTNKINDALDSIICVRESWWDSTDVQKHAYIHQPIGLHIDLFNSMFIY